VKLKTKKNPGDCRDTEPQKDTGETVENSSGSRSIGIALRTYSGQKSSTSSPPLRDDELIVRFLPMVHKIAHRVVSYLKPPLSFEDLISAGTVGLVRAARDFDSSHQTEFKTYAYIRIKGAIIDELRSTSLLPVNVNKQVRIARQLCQKITEQTGTAPTDNELAEKLGITVEEVYELFENARIQHFISIDGLMGDSSSADGFSLSDKGRDVTTPDKQMEQAELIDTLSESIQQLDQRRRQIILLYYQQHLTMKQIADMFKITESRVSQLHSSALFSLSVKLRQWQDDK
jgi:RNA polymerase sigma factor for flagellar operon FliA